METRSLTVSVNFPDLDEFEDSYPQYGPFARRNGRFLFELIMSVDSFIKARGFTELHYPAVTGVAELCFQAVDQNRRVEFNNFLRQFIGAVVCSMMEVNHYQKTNRKRYVPHHAFTKGEVYAPTR
jgi:hypothetical protein